MEERRFHTQKGSDMSNRSTGYVGESPRSAKVREVRDAAFSWLAVVCLIVAVGWAYLEAAS